MPIVPSRSYHEVTLNNAFPLQPDLVIMTLSPSRVATLSPTLLHCLFAAVLSVGGTGSDVVTI